MLTLIHNKWQNSVYSVKDDGEVQGIFFRMICSTTNFKNNSGSYRVNLQLSLSQWRALQSWSLHMLLQHIGLTEALTWAAIPLPLGVQTKILERWVAERIDTRLIFTTHKYPTCQSLYRKSYRREILIPDIKDTTKICCFSEWLLWFRLFFAWFI